MPDNHSYPGGHLNVKARAQPFSDRHPKGAFADIHCQHQHPPPEPNFIEDVHGAHIAAANLADVYTPSELTNDKSRRHRANHIAQQNSQDTEYDIGIQKTYPLGKKT